MAIWQFDMSLLPASAFPGTPLDGSVILEEYFSGSFNRDTQDDRIANYWTNVDTWQFRSLLADLFGQEKECWGNGLIFGAERETCAYIWDDEVSVRIDARKFDPLLFEKLVNFAFSSELLFVFNETGQLRKPSSALLLQSFIESRAYRFISNPENVLREAADRLNRK